MSNKTVHWIETNGDTRVEQRSKPIPLEDLQKFVSGYIEHIWVRYNGVQSTMYVNEDGRLFNLPINEQATKILQDCILFGNQKIRGPAIIIEGGDFGEDDEN